MKVSWQPPRASLACAHLGHAQSWFSNDQESRLNSSGYGALFVMRCGLRQRTTRPKPHILIWWHDVAPRKRRQRRLYVLQDAPSEQSHGGFVVVACCAAGSEGR